MQALRQWSFARVLLLSVGWLFACVLTTAVWLLFQFRDVLGVSSGSGGIGAVSIGVNGLVLAIPILPPVILILAWVVARWFS